MKTQKQKWATPVYKYEKVAVHKSLQTTVEQCLEYMKKKMWPGEDQSVFSWPSLQSLGSLQCTRCGSNNNAIRSKGTLRHWICLSQLQQHISFYIFKNITMSMTETFATNKPFLCWAISQHLRKKMSQLDLTRIRNYCSECSN